MTALRTVFAAALAASALVGAASSAQAGGYGYGSGYSYTPVYKPVCHYETRTDYYGHVFQVKVCN